MFSQCSLFRYDLWELVTNVVSVSEPFVKVLRIINGGKPPMGYILCVWRRPKRPSKLCVREMNLNMDP